MIALGEAMRQGQSWQLLVNLKHRLGNPVPSKYMLWAGRVYSYIHGVRYRGGDNERQSLNGATDNFTLLSQNWQESPENASLALLLS